MAQWDFAGDIADLLDRTNLGDGPRSMSEMIEAAQAVVRVGRSHPAQLQRWLNDHAETLIGQQILVASVHAQSSPETEPPGCCVRGERMHPAPRARRPWSG